MSLDEVKVTIDLIALKVEYLENKQEKNEALIAIQSFVESLKSDESPFRNSIEEKVKKVSIEKRSSNVGDNSHKEKDTVVCEETSDIEIVHTERKKEANFKCQKCGQCFKKRNHLQRHITRNRGKRTCGISEPGMNDFACSVCDFKTSAKDNLQNHMIKHSGRYLCDTCNCGFSREKSLLRHKGNPSNCDKFLKFMETKKNAVNPGNKTRVLTTYPSYQPI